MDLVHAHFVLVQKIHQHLQRSDVPARFKGSKNLPLSDLVMKRPLKKIWLAKASKTSLNLGGRRKYHLRTCLVATSF